MFTADCQKLKEALNKVSKVIDSAPLSSILGSVLIETAEDELKLTGSDGQIEISTSCKATVEKSGVGKLHAVNASKLNSILSNIKSKEVTFKIEKSTYKITSGQANFSLSTRSGKEYPTMEKAKKSSFKVELPKVDLLITLRRIETAISNLTHRINLSGAYFDFGEKDLTLVATDGHRMVTDVIKVKDISKANFILPRKTVKELIRLLELDKDKNVVLNAEFKNGVYRQATFKLKDVTINSSLIPDDYPIYGRVIPDEETNNNTMEFPIQSMLESVKQVCSVQDKSGEPIELKLNGQSLVVSAKGSNEEDTAQVGVKVDTKNKEFISKLNSQYVQDMLNAFTGHTEIKMYYKNGKEKLLFCPAKSKDNSQLKYVVMPVR